MWRKGNYDVSNRQHENIQPSVVEFDEQQTIINFEKTESALDRPKWISRIQKKLVVWLIGALFLIIFVLIGVTIWLSLSIHQNNRDNIRTISSALHLLISEKYKQKSGQNSADGIVRDIGRSCGISCAEILRATFHLTEHETTIEEANFAKNSLPNRLHGATTIMSTSNEKFPLVETSHHTKCYCFNESELILKSPPINETSEGENTDDDSGCGEDSSDEVDKDGKSIGNEMI